MGAEKKALAMLFSYGEDELSISINFNACMDCHEFFKISSQMLGRRIQLRQPQMTHTFIAGNCSCNDRWSWEARLTPAMRKLPQPSQKRTRQTQRQILYLCKRVNVWFE